MLMIPVDNSSTSSVRHRQPNDADVNDVDQLLRHHAEMQQRIAEEMVELARNLKDNVQASGHIVREDVKVCD